MTTSPRRITPRVVDAAASAASRLALEPCLRVSLGDAGMAMLRLRPAAPASIAQRAGLTVSTRFGLIGWFDYEAWLLAWTGIDVDTAQSASARDAFVQYALAALPAPLGAALGGPVYDVSAPGPWAERADSLVVCLCCLLSSVSVSMHLRLDADALGKMIEHGPWQPQPASIAPRLARLPGRQRVVAGSLAMPHADVERLASGDIIRLPAPGFDTAGVGRLVLAGLRLQVRWHDAHSRFEVLQMTHDDTLPPTDTPAALPSGIPNPIDLAHLPVQLSFVLGTLELTLGALAAIRTGSLLRLVEGMPPTVRIEANGVPVGYGELVDLDGRLAVQITQWHNAPADAASP